MNRQFLFLIVLLMLLAGCSADEGALSVDGDTADGLIRFSIEGDDVGSRAMTRAYATFPTDKTLRVFAWDVTNENWLMRNGDEGDPNSNVVSFNADKGYWQPKGKYSWPESRLAPLDFYALYPDNMTFSTDTRYIDRRSKGISGNDDVLYCKVRSSKYDATWLERSIYAAQIRFEHALSRITFAKKLINHVTLYVNSLTLQNIKHKGTFAFDPAQWTDDSAVSPSTTTYTVTPEEKDNLNESDNYLLLMPQTLAEGAQIVVEYKIKSEDGVWLRGDDDNWDEQTIPISGDWLIGHKHTYTLTANHDIWLTTTIEPWSNADDNSVPVKQEIDE